jgi:hypothetical protein
MTLNQYIQELLEIEKEHGDIEVVTTPMSAPLHAVQVARNPEVHYLKLKGPRESWRKISNRNTSPDEVSKTKVILV